MYISLLHDRQDGKRKKSLTLSVFLIWKRFGSREEIGANKLNGLLSAIERQLAVWFIQLLEKKQSRGEKNEGSKKLQTLADMLDLW